MENYFISLSEEYGISVSDINVIFKRLALEYDIECLSPNDIKHLLRDIISKRFDIIFSSFKSLDFTVKNTSENYSKVR